MTYSQPQQQQAPYRPNRAALWVNSRKSAANQPDYKGNLEISWALFQELTAAFNSGQYAQDGGGQPCIKLDLALYVQQGGVSASGKARPILSGQLSTVAETAQSAAMRQQAAQQYAPQPQQAYAPQPQAPAPMPQAAPPQPQYAPQTGPQYAPQTGPQYAPQQPPQPQVPAPVAPPAPAQPMPGAIHGQPPAGPAPVLPQGF